MDLTPATTTLGQALTDIASFLTTQTVSIAALLALIGAVGYVLREAFRATGLREYTPEELDKFDIEWRKHKNSAAGRRRSAKLRSISE